MKLKVEQVGPEKFVRYVIACENGVYYANEKGWTPDKRKAARYASLAVAKKDWKRLQAEMETGLTVMTASVVVTVKAASELTPQQIEELKWWMSSVSSFTLDYKVPRPEWLADAVVSSQIVWNSLKKKQ
jgi:hypothetical protein